MKLFLIKKFCNKQRTKIIIFFTICLFFILLVEIKANCWTSDLSEEDQLAMARKTFEDGVYSASSETAKCYLDVFKNGKAREEMFFLRAEALRKGGDLKNSMKAYDELKKNFPQSKSYLDNAMLQQGISLTLKSNYNLAINTLNFLLKDYPTSKFRDEAHYWLGYASSFNADIFQEKNKNKAKKIYKNSIRYFNNGESRYLSQEQKNKRWYLIGHAWWNLGEIKKAAKAWNNYLKEIDFSNPEKSLKIKFQLASGFQREKNYSDSEKWFARVVKGHKRSELAIESSFWRAEMAYADSLQKYKTIPKKRALLIVKHYDVYLEKNDEMHRALSYYRIGNLEQNIRPINSINAFKNYLSTEDKIFSNEVQYRLAHLYINTKQPQKAINVFKNYLSSGDKTYSNEVKYQLGYLYVNTMQPKKAIKIFEEYLDGEKKENYSEIQIRLGYLFIDTKQPQKAIQIFEKYLDGKNKEYAAEAKIRLGYLYIETSQINKAIQIFEKYLEGESNEHFLEIKLRLAYLYVGEKQIPLAISLFEQVRQNDGYRQNKELLKSLLVLYRENVPEEKYIKFLIEVRSDQKLDESFRQEFQTNLVLAYYQQKKCDKLLIELNDKPGYLQTIKNLRPDEWEHLIFLKGNCLIILKKWNESRNIFRLTRESEKYREQSIEMLLEAHRQLEDWKGITWEFQEIFDRGSPTMTIPYFQLWMFAAQKRNDFQRLDRIKMISDRWKELFPEDSQNLSNINQYLSTSQIQELSKQEKWLEISNFIRKGVKSGKINLDEQIFSQLLYSEQKLKNWKGILSAYTLLSIYDQTRVEKIDALINQAKAAENLGKKELAIEFYKKALKIKPNNEYEKKTQTDIKEYLAIGIFQNLIEKEEWTKVSNIIYKEVKEKKRILDEKNFELLLYVENKKSGKEKYNGILAAYKLLNVFNKNDANTVEALLEQAKAAEELGKKNLAQNFYRKISKKIHKEVKAKKRILDEKNFKLLLFTENKKPPKEKFNGILDAYALLSIFDKKKTLTIEALINQGYAAEKLGGYKRAKKYYNSALKKVPDKKFNLAIQLVGELTRLYERSKDYESLIQVYKKAYNVLKKNNRSKKEYQTYAYLIGYHYSTHLKQNNKSRIWMMRADGGGSSSQEVQAGFWVARIDLDAKKNEKAFKRLKELTGRKISTNSAIYSQIHFEIATLYHLKENWESALRHFRFVAKANPPNSLKQLKADAIQNVKDIDNYLKSIQNSE